MNGSDWREPAARLAARLADEGLDARWTAVFAAVPRHEFTGDGRAVGDDGTVGDATSWDRAELLRQAYADQVVVTRFATIAGERIATSSASQPAIMAIMLRLLRVGECDRVLEIGTGPGYNAALLSTRLGSGRVTSVDVQPDVVDEARERLARLGLTPHLEAADGTLGCPSRAPFDRIIATCGLSRIPPGWLDQLAPGARIVAPLNFGGALAVLDRRHDGSTTGHFPREAGFFMELRHPGEKLDGEPPGYLAVPPRVFDAEGDVETLGDLDFRLWLELGIAGAQLMVFRGDDGRVREVHVRTDDARAEVRNERRGVRVKEYGERLWPRVAESLGEWRERGRPGRTRLGLTVTRERQWVWLDREDSGVEWGL